MAVADVKPRKTKKADTDPPGSLVVSLHAPGMTPLLRAGVGGLAASLRAIHRDANPKAKWEDGVVVPLGPGCAKVTNRDIALSWPENGLRETFKALWDGSFRLSNGVIFLPGAHREAFDGTNAIPARIQDGLKCTFLQHGKSTTKSGVEKTISIDLGDTPFSFTYQPYENYAHAAALVSVTTGILRSQAVELPGWAFPGAAQRHVAHGSTRAEFAPDLAIAAVFALVGCLSLPAGIGGGGFLVIPEPSDLVGFARVLSVIQPSTLPDTSPASLGDAVLLAEFSLLLEGLEHPCIASLHGTWLKAMAWDKKQKYRAALVELRYLPQDAMPLLSIVRSELPPRFIATKKNGTWIRPSHLRAFACDNLVRGRPWYEGFATHSILESKKTRFLHTYWSSEKGNLGALQHSERKGLILMTEKLPEPEHRLVRTMHEAIRNQFGKIASTQKALGGDIKKRFQDERQRIRIAFSGAKTQDQVRLAFADLWSRAGSLPTLQQHWEEIASLVHGPKWMLARDLALVALASYQGQRPEEEEHAEDSNEAPE